MKLLESVRVLVVSFECVIILLAILLYYYWPLPFISIGTQFKLNSEIWKFIPTIPLAICGFSIQYAWKILYPSENDLNRILLNWPGYWKLKLRVIVSVILCLTCVFFAIFIWIYSGSLSEKTVGAFFISTVAISATVAFNQMLAAFKIRELLEIKR